jgi:peptide/nickel transport system permease protein
VRNVRAEVLTLKTRDYIALARIAGASDIRILIKHILPGVVNTIVVLATLRVGGLILAEASLSFLGAGIPSATPTWGNMISEGREWLSTAWWIAVFPGIAILLVVMSMNFLGDWLRDRWDPKLRQL